MPYAFPIQNQQFVVLGALDRSSSRLRQPLRADLSRSLQGATGAETYDHLMRCEKV